MHFKQFEIPLAKTPNIAFETFFLEFTHNLHAF